MNAYDGLSEVYDFWQEENDPRIWADYAERLIARFCKVPRGDGAGGSLIVADLGCGTGSIAIEMAGRGYDVLGIDASTEMLSVAIRKNTDSKVRFVCQDITRMELYGTVDVMLCLLDTVNHITDRRRLDAFFRMCKRYLNIGGILIFDAATEHYLRKVRGNNTFAESGEPHVVLWQNFYEPSRRLSTATVTVFSDNGSGCYDRRETTIRERFYHPTFLETLGADHGLNTVAVFADFAMRRPGPESQRMFFVMENRVDDQKASLVRSV
jgi:SAM-dependent methyltransferase